MYTYIGPIKELITLADLPIRGALSDDQLHPLKNDGILIKDGTIEQIDVHEKLYEKAQNLNAHLEILEEDFCALPGFIDSHTHICFGGSRARDYAMRNAGKTYLEIAEAGGGIWDTVTETRKATQEQLVEDIVKRANLLLQKGITTIDFQH